MSHLSKIQTQLQDQNILIESLDNLGIKWSSPTRSMDNIKLQLNHNGQSVELIKSNGKYDIVTDVELWTSSTELQAFLDKIYQKYAQHTIIKTSNKQGFSQEKITHLQDGSVVINLEKWT